MADEPSWTGIPSLLLVRGDFIALQVGELAPANCVQVDVESETPLHIAAGDRLSLESLGQTANEVVQNLPRGRSTIPPWSEHLLTLCNKKCIFQVLEPPLKQFIARPFGTL